MRPQSPLVMILLLSGIGFAFPSYSQKYLVLSGGLDLSGLSYNYSFQQQGNVLKRGWLNPNGKSTNGSKYAFNSAAHYRVSRRFGIETGLRFSEEGLSVYDSRFLNTYGIKGGTPINNINGTYSDNGNFNLVEWYLSNYVSGYYFIPNKSRLEPYVSGGIAYNYFVSLHSNISNSFLYIPTSENLTISAHYSAHYLSAFLEAGLLIHSQLDKSKGPVFFVGIKYFQAGRFVTADYESSKNGSLLYSDHVTASGNCLSLSVRAGGILWKR